MVLVVAAVAPTLHGAQLRELLGGVVRAQRHLDDARRVAQRLRRIGHQVHDDLVDLRVVGVDGRRVGVEVRSQLDRGGHRGPQQVNRLLQRPAQVHGRARQLAMAAERQDALYQLAAAVGRAAHLVEIRQRLLRGQGGRDQLGVADDGAQQVVEVVRDAAGQRPDGLHLLRLPKPVLQHAARADVHDGAQHEDAAVGGDRVQAYLDGDLRAVLSQAVQVPPGAHGARLRLVEETLAVGGVATAEALGHQHVDRPADQLASRVPEQPLDLAVDHHDDAGIVDDEDARGRQLEGQAIKVQFLFGQTVPSADIRPRLAFRVLRRRPGMVNGAWPG